MPERETDPASLLCPGGNEHGRGGGRGSSWRKQTKRGIRPFNVLHQSWPSSWMDPNWGWQGQYGQIEVPELCVAGGASHCWLKKGRWEKSLGERVVCSSLPHSPPAALLPDAGHGLPPGAGGRAGMERGALEMTGLSSPARGPKRQSTAETGGGLLL